MNYVSQVVSNERVQLEAIQRDGHRAISAWQDAFKTGSFDALLSMIDPKIEFRFGIPPFNVITYGMDQLQQAVSFLKGLEIRVDQHAVTAPLFNFDTVAFEFNAVGWVGSKAVDTTFIVLFKFSEGRITSMREYSLPGQ